MSDADTILDFIRDEADLDEGEVTQLDVLDLDFHGDVVSVRCGKGGKDRFVMLSERLLKMLRGYWSQVRPGHGWLFPGRKNGTHLNPSAVRWALAEAVNRAKLKKRVSAHTLRHSFATHLHELGSDVRFIQVVLGHASIRTTARYTQVSKKHIAAVKSPLDVLGTQGAAALG